MATTALVLEAGDHFTLVTKHQVVVCEILTIRDRTATAINPSANGTDPSPDGSVGEAADAINPARKGSMSEVEVSTKERLIRAASK